MRSFDFVEEDEIKKLNAKPWQLDLILANWLATLLLVLFLLAVLLDSSLGHSVDECHQKFVANLDFIWVNHHLLLVLLVLVFLAHGRNPVARRASRVTRSEIASYCHNASSLSTES